MRRSVVLLALCISCGKDPGESSPVDAPESVYLVSGMVADSMLSRAILGVRVLVGDSVAVSDSHGRFSTMHRSGNFDLRVDDYGFERYEIPLTIFGNQSQLVLLRGEAPYLLSCSFETDLLTATVVDLQGRKTLNRRSQSTMSLISNNVLFFREAYDWYWTPVDNYTWLAHVPHPGVVADTADWRLEDADGYVRSARCVNQGQACGDCPDSAIRDLSQGGVARPVRNNIA